MLSPTMPFVGGFSASLGGGSSGFSGRDIVWVDLRFPGGVGNNGTEELPFNTANLGLGVLPSGGTLVMVGGDASAEPGVTIGAGSGAFVGLGGQKASGGLTPVLPTLTYAITTGTQRLAFRNISVALVHSGTVASLGEFYFEFCPTVTLTAGGDASPVSWIGAPGNIFSGSGGAAQFIGGTIAGYVANGAGSIIASGCNITSDLTSTSSITLVGACTFGGPVSITAPSIQVDAATKKKAEDAGVTFSSPAQLLASFAAPVDVGTANAAGTEQSFAHSDHVHNVPFSVVLAALALASSAIGFNGQRLSNLGAPISPNDAARLVDLTAAASGLKVKTSALVVATANQATMSGTAQTIDGVALNTIGMRVLLIAQTTATQNGLWLVQSGAWTRPVDGSIPANDFSTGSSAAQSYVLVTSGTASAGNSYFCTNAAGSDVVDTANLNWTIFNQPPVLIAGAGLTKTGNTLDVVANADGTIVVAADDVKVGVIGNANLADNTIALARLANAGGQNHFAMRVSSGSGAWEDGTLAQAQAALGITSSGALKSVRAATTANITLSGTQTIDGVALIAGDRCLVKNQTTGSQNGIYVVAAGAWSRATDAASTGQLFGGLLVPISEGTANGNQVAQLTTDDPITIGTTSLTFTMGRVAALGAVAPLDVTKSAASIGTSTLAAPLDHKHDVATAAPVAGAVVANGTAAEGTATSVARSDHIHAVAVATPVDIGTANAAGSAATFVRSDHVHALTFAVAAAVLAVASTSISVNSQKITSLATPTVSTDAATKGYVDSVVLGFAPPANPGDNGKIAYANAGALAYATNIKTDGTRYQFGTTGTGGLLNFAQSSNIAFGANNVGTQVVPLVRWGSPSPVALVDGLYIGSTSGDAGKVANMRFGVHTGGGFQWEVNGAAAATLASGGISILQGAVTSGIAPVALLVLGGAHTGLTASSEPLDISLNLTRTVSLAAGAIPLSRVMRITAPTYSFASASTISVAATLSIATSPLPGTNATITNALALLIESGAIGLTTAAAQSGLLRAPGNSLLLAARGTVGGYDVPVASVDASDHLVLGGSGTNSPTTNYYNTRTAGLHVFQVNATDLCSISSTIFDFKSLAASFGPNPPTSGDVRVTYGFALKAKGVGTYSVISAAQVFGTDDSVLIGDNTANKVECWVASSGTYAWRVNSNLEYAFNATYADYTNNQIRFGTNPSTTALINGPQSGAILLASQNAANSAAIACVTTNSSNEVLVGDASNAANLYHQTAGSSFFKQGLTTFGRMDTGVGLLLFNGIATYYPVTCSTVTLGANAAASGLVRGPANTTIVSVKSSVSGDLPLLGTDGADELILGGTNVANILATVSSGSYFAVNVNTTTKFTVNTNTVDIMTNNLKLGNTAGVPSAPASGGYIYESGGQPWHVSSTGVATAMAPIAA